MKLSSLSFVMLLAAAASAQSTTTTTTTFEVIDERAILLEFYHATGGPSWNTNKGWNDVGNGYADRSIDADDYCQWHGVLCMGDADLDMFGVHARRRQLEEEEDDSDRNAGTEHTKFIINSSSDLNTKVMGLDLPDNFLQGRVPPSLWTLPLLQYVNVNGNENLQVDFSNVQEAKQLSLLKMEHTATTSLAGLDHASLTLNVLHLSYTPLRSKLSLELLALTNLRDLQLSHCDLEGGLEGIQALSNLRELNLFDNHLKGPLPTDLFANGVLAKRLEKLSLAKNQLTGSLQVFNNQNFPQLEELFVAENQFVGQLPDLSSARRLKKLQANSNRLTGTIPANFLLGLLELDANYENDAPTIKVDLSRNQLTGALPETLDELEDLSMEFILSDNKFTNISQTLCDNEYWNLGMVANYGCDGILCPPASYGTMGHATNDHACHSCPQNADYYGATSCVQANDRSTLLSLYATTDGEHWYNNSGWAEAYDNAASENLNDVCDWYGIECWEGDDPMDDTDGRVRVIRLEANNLVGEVPEDILKLEYLHSLLVARNPNLVVPMTQMSESSTLRHLDVSQTATVSFQGFEYAQDEFAYLIADGLALGGTLPTQILNVTSLRLLSMSECELIGSVPTRLGNLRQLNELYLFDNHLRGTLPSELGNMAMLRFVSLAQNQLTGTIPTTLDTLQELQAFSLADQVRKGGGITGPLHHFRFHPFLRSLQLNNNLLQGTIPIQLMEGTESLTENLQVDLSYNHLTGNVPGELARFQAMELDLQGNRFTQLDSRLCENAKWMNGLVGEFGCDAILCPQGTASVGGKQQFTNAPCNDCPNSKEIVAAGGASLSWMGQEHCSLQFTMEENDEQGLVELLFQQTKGEQWKNNRNWLLQKKQVDGGSIHVCDWYGIACDESKSIVGITLGGNNLQGTFPTEIYMLPKLEVLSLFGNDKMSISMDGIDNAKNLRSLVLDSTGLKSLDGIGKARSLTELNVQSNSLKGVIPEEFARLINLKSLDISKNELEGPIPYWINNLPALETLLASENNLKGPLPDFSSFKYITYLDLGYNKLTGEIPLDFLSAVNVDDKIVVDLSDNEIEGTIPRELAQISRLTLHLKDNKIDEIDRELCNVKGWNDFDVERFGCDGILCPAGTSTASGRQTSAQSICVPCDNAKHMGSTACYATSAAATSSMQSVATVIMAFTTTLALVFFL